MLGTSPHVARDILDKTGLQPVFFGRGRGRGCRWLYSAVLALIKTRFAEAQEQGQKARKRVSKGFSFTGLNASDVFALTQKHAIQ